MPGLGMFRVGKHRDAVQHLTVPTFWPRGVCAATAARSMSPVARWHRQCSFFMAGLWVPFPQPGGPATANLHASTAAANTHMRVLHAAGESTPGQAPPPSSAISC